MARFRLACLLAPSSSVACWPLHEFSAILDKIYVYFLEDFPEGFSHSFLSLPQLVRYSSHFCSEEYFKSGPLIIKKSKLLYLLSLKNITQLKILTRKWRGQKLNEGEESKTWRSKRNNSNNKNCLCK